MFYLSAVAVTIVAFQLMFFPGEVWLVWFEILSMLAAVGWLAMSRRTAWHEKWLHDRYPAELLRTAI